MNELSVNNNSITFSVGKVDFKDYDKILADAKVLANAMMTSVVDDETVKTNKKLLAQVRKQVKSLDDERIRVKKEILQPYDLLDSQIKDIKAVINEADSYIDSQVKAIEKKERETREYALQERYEMRKGMYENPGEEWPLKWEDFIRENPKVLNKSVTFEMGEQRIAEWYEKKNDDLYTIEQLPNAEEVMIEYINDPRSVSDAIHKVALRMQSKKLATEKLKAKKVPIIKLVNADDLQAVQDFMNKNNIKFTIEF